MRSIRYQLSLWMVAATLSLSALAGVFCYLEMGAIVGRQFDATLRARGRAICSTVQREANGSLEFPPIDETMPEFGAVHHPDYLQVRDVRGQVVFRSPS